VRFDRDEVLSRVDLGDLADALLGDSAGLLRTLQPEDLEWLLS